MIADFRDPAVSPDQRADVCIVGSGPAALAVADRLLGTGTRVILVESGGLEPDAAVSGLNRGAVVGHPVGLEHGRARVLGGTGTVWPGQCVRLDRSDLQPRAWVPDSGWPLRAEELEPYYGRAEAWLGLGDALEADQGRRRFGAAAPPFRPERLTHAPAAWTPQPNIGARYLRTFESATGFTVLLHATAARLCVPPGRREPDRLEIRSLGGRVGAVRAARFVLCAGGIENARLLLLSGLGNGHDVVGRYLQDHPTVWASVETDRPGALQEFYGLYGRGKVRSARKVGLGWETQRRQRVLNASATFVWDRADSPGLAAARKISSAAQHRRLPDGLTPTELRALAGEAARIVGAGYRRFARGRPTAAPLDAVRVKLLLEQAPNPASRIHLSDERDALGLPRASVDWRLTELERRTAQVMIDTLDGELDRLGLGRVRPPDHLAGDDWRRDVEDAYHPTGTTRMSADPRTGVVDTDCRVHGTAAVYVCGSSVFPTGGHANPTLTVVALALRVADHVRATAGRLAA